MTAKPDKNSGKWRGILMQLGVPAKVLDGKHHQCPICGDGKDRFRFDDREGRGTFYCSVCGAGDGYGFIKGLRRVDFDEAKRIANELAGTVKADAIKRPLPAGRAKAAMRELWSTGERADPTTGLGRYLCMRGIVLDAMPKCLRFMPACRYVDDDETVRHFPAMLAAVVGVDGVCVNIHRTYLSPDCSTKADVPEPRKTMAGTIPPGSAVRLGDVGVDGILGVAEGIETALAASIMFDLPVWACLNENRLAAFELPEGINVRSLIVYGDNDTNFVGQSAAYALARKAVTKWKLSDVRVAIPAAPGSDWNDALIDRRVDEMMPARMA